MLSIFKAKYVYDPVSLTYKQIPLWGKRNKIKMLLATFALFLIAGVMSLFLIHFFTSPNEKILISKNNELEERYKQLNNKLVEYTHRVDSLNYKDDSIYRMVFGVQSISPQIRTAGYGGTWRANNKKENEELVASTSRRIKQLENKLKVSENSYNELLDLAKVNVQKMLHIPAIMPVANESLKRTGSGFGKRFHPILNIWRMHEGLDFIGNEETHIFATANGMVKKRYRSKTFGNVLIIDHGYGYETYYAHLLSYKVNLGQKVKRGELIGLMGTTGLSSGVHLHYEVHLNGKEVDPINYFYNDLSPEQFKAIRLIANGIKTSMD